jgi:hypothetical protein
MENNDSAANAVIGAPCPPENFSSPQLSLGSPEEGERLMRAFLDITNPALRNIILDMVSALAWQDSQIGPALTARRSSTRTIPCDGGKYRSIRPI